MQLGAAGRSLVTSRLYKFILFLFFNAEGGCLFFFFVKGMRATRASVERLVEQKGVPRLRWGTRVFSLRLSSGSEHWVHEIRNDE